MKISFVTPLYNEERDLEKNIQKILAFAQAHFKESEILGKNSQAHPSSLNFEIIAVDDGSSDGTWSVLQTLQSNIIRIAQNPRNMGPGAAFRRGFAMAQGDVIITLDSDLSYPIEDTEKLLAKLEEGYGGVIASPFVGGAGYAHAPFFRVLLSKLGTLLYTLVLGQRLSTYTGFYRAYRKELITAVLPLLEADGFESQVELIWRARQRGYRFAEVPSFQNYDPSRGSKFNVPREMSRHLRFLFFRIIPGQVKHLLGK